MVVCKVYLCICTCRLVLTAVSADPWNASFLPNMLWHANTFLMVPFSAPFAFHHVACFLGTTSAVNGNLVGLRNCCLHIMPLHGNGSMCSCVKHLSRCWRIVFWSNRRPCGSLPAHRAVQKASANRPQSFPFTWRFESSNCRVMLGSLDTIGYRPARWSTVEPSCIYRLSYTFTVEYEQPIVDMVSQCLLFQCSTWTNSSPPTISNVHV